MSTLCVDITPLAINRTAMYFIVRDTVRHLIQSGYPVQLQALGYPIDLPEFIANDFALPAGLDAKVGARLRRALENPAAFREPPQTLLDGDSARRINFVFDPLYLLFMAPARRTIAYVLDVTPITRPTWHGERVSRLYEKAFARLYDPSIYIVSISESTARDLWANYGVPRSRGRVVPLYDRLDHSRATARHPSKQFLFVGSLEVRKNIVGLVEGFAMSNLASQGYTLRIVGGDAHGADRIKAAVSGVPGAVLCGRLSDEQLQVEYERCCCLAYPSLWEGFGLPALEALARGIPLLLSDTGALPEVGGPFAIYVDPCNPCSIANGLIAATSHAEAGWSVPSDVDGRTKWRAKFSRGTYLAIVIDIVNAISTELPGHDLKRDVLTDASAPLSDSRPPLGTHRGPTNWRRRLACRIRNSRIVPATLRPVPGNSFSLDYLYCLQQERRMRLSRAMSRFMSGEIWLFPIHAGYVLAEMVSLMLTNVLIKSMVNEFVLQKLSARMDRTND